MSASAILVWWGRVVRRLSSSEPFAAWSSDRLGPLGPTVDVAQTAGSVAGVFVPIKKPADLPPKGPSNEGQHREFKSKQTEDRYEIAKDVAAFANADGGTILIGARGNGEYLADYEPLTTKEASAAQEVCDEGVHTRCAPPPIYSVEPVEKEVPPEAATSGKCPLRPAFLSSFVRMIAFDRTSSTCEPWSAERCRRRSNGPTRHGTR